MKSTEIVLELRNLADKIEDSVITKDSPKIKLEALRGLLASKSKEGKTAEIKALLQEFGANKLSDIAPECYEPLYEKAVKL